MTKWNYAREQTLLILVAGLYRSGTNDNPDKIAENVKTNDGYCFTSL
jgi:hypothetical protein